MQLPGYNNLTCHQVQLKMSLYIENDPYLTDEEHEAFEAHLESCGECAREYEESRFVISLVKRYWIVSEDTLALIENANQPTKSQMTVEEGWEDLCRRCPDLAKSKEKSRSLQLLFRIVAFAACLVIGILTWMVFSYALRPHTLLQPSSTKQVASVHKPSVKVELISGDGKSIIPAGYRIAAAKELKNLTINNKHQLVMNIDTTLMVEPLVESSRLGCLVKLASGEIFAHVQHDGNPFIVDTAHGQAVITGTIFDIKATEDSTTLAVSEGTIQFESENGVVNVAAGQISKIIGRSAPSIPISCNTAELTVWVTGYEPGPALAQAESDTDSWYLSLSLREEPIVLEETDYDYWIEQKRDWFKLEFPWIFQLKEALAKEGIEVDYPELLIQSGDVWQFAFLDVAPARFSVADPNSLLKTASNYGFDKQWLLEHVPMAKSVSEKPVLSGNSFTGLKAFEKWLDYLDETKKIKLSTSIYSFHASKYLAETRSLIWFAVKDGRYDLTDEEHTKVLDLLQKEVAAACKCQNDVSYPEDFPEPSCYEDRHHELAKYITKLVSDIYGYEKRLVIYILPVSLVYK